MTGFDSIAMKQRIDTKPVAGQQFDYRFDDLGNRDTTGGRASAVSDYTANRRNQYTSRTVPPYVDVLGLANPTADVTVNGNVATRKGECFHYALNVPNTTAQYPTITETSQYGAQQSTAGEVFVPATPESFGCDADGNLTTRTNHGAERTFIHVEPCDRWTDAIRSHEGVANNLLASLGWMASAGLSRMR